MAKSKNGKEEKAKTGKKETPQNTEKPKERFCSFCERSSTVLALLIAAPHNVYICEECVDVCTKILNEAKAEIYSPKITQRTRTAASTSRPSSL